MIVPINYYIIAVTDREDEGTKLISIVSRYMSRYHHKFTGSQVVRVESEDLHVAMVEVMSTPADVIIILGGLGTGMYNVTIPVVEKYLDSRLPGFEEFFRAQLVKAIGLKSMFYRALAGTIRNRHVFCIPENQKIVETVTEKIISRASALINDVK